MQCALGSTVVSGSVLTGSRLSSFFQLSNIACELTEPVTGRRAGADVQSRLFNSHTTLKSVELGFLPILLNGQRALSLRATCRQFESSVSRRHCENHNYDSNLLPC